MTCLRRPRPSAVVAAAVLSVALGACGGGETRTGGAGAPGTTDSSESPTASSATPSESAQEPTDTAEPSESAVPPATGGPVLRTEDGVSVTTPSSFRQAQVSEDGGIAIIFRADDLTEISLSTGALVGEPDFEAYKEIARTTRESLPGLRVLPDLELLGQPAYHFVSEVTEFQRQDIFGVALLEEDLTITLRIVTLKEMPAAEREELVRSVLASLALA